MTIQQASDPGISGEWIPVAEQQRASVRSPAAVGRRERAMRMVKVMMVALVGLTLVGLISFAWRRHAMQVDLEPAAGEPARANAAP